MNKETLLNIVDFIADLDIITELLEYSVKTHKLNVPDDIKNYLLTEIEYDKKVIAHKNEVREKVMLYLKNENAVIDLSFN